MSTLDAIIGALKGLNNESTGNSTGLYGAIFGSEPIPLTLSLEPETRQTVLLTAGILAAGAILTALVLKKIS
jgi:hypothetical protein